MDDSILNSIKKVLNVSADDTSFDVDIIMHINSTFSKMTHDLGLGPTEGFMIEDAEPTWGDFSSDVFFNDIRTYVYLCVRVLFDPPQTGYLNEAMTNQILQLEWRLCNRMRNEEGADV